MQETHKHPEYKGTVIYREVQPLKHPQEPPKEKGNLARMAGKIVEKISGGVESVIEMIHEATAKPESGTKKRRKKWQPPQILHPLPPIVNYVSLEKEKIKRPRL